jgi:hypothetical protein
MKNFLLFLPITAFGISVTPLITQESYPQLLYLSSDDQVKCLKNNQASLVCFNQNKKTELFTQKKEAQFNLVASTAKRKMLFTVDETFLSIMSLQKLLPIYQVSFAQQGAVLLGQGTTPMLHQEDVWASYYTPSKKEITLKSLASDTVHKITLNNPIDPYYTPNRVFERSDLFYYSDLNEKGEEALVSYNIESKKFTFIYKTEDSSKRLDFCWMNKKLYLSEFKMALKGSVKITEIDYPKNAILAKKTTLYERDGDFLPRVICRSMSKQVIILQYTSPFTTQISVINADASSAPLTTQVNNRLTQLTLLDQRILGLSSGKPFEVLWP